eukprot:m.64137 g.64137  ORF g.64137 m.64137 type:complete len:446 (+) comp23394_c1_seq1:283-1620(+)
MSVASQLISVDLKAQMRNHTFEKTPNTDTLVNKNKTKEKMWYLHGKAYDFKPWMDKHPGGAYILKITKGTDCTELFESYHAPSLKGDYIQKTLGQYEVEMKDIAATTYEWDITPVYDELKEVVREYRRTNGIKGTDSPFQMAWYALWGVLHHLMLPCWLFGWGGMGDAVTALLFGWTVWFWSGDLLHAGTHYALSTNTAYGEWLGWVGGWLFCLPSTWIRQHVTGHHVHTNVHQRDPDLYHHSRYYRAFSKIEPQWWHSFWHLTWITAFTQIIPSAAFTMDILLFNKWKNTVTELKWAPYERLQLFIVWAVFVTMLGTVLYQQGATVALLPFTLVGVLYYMFSQVSHCNALSFEQPSSGEWAVHQLYTTQGDYSYASKFWNHMSLGLHNQALHHLFPSVHPCHYPAISKLARPILKRHGLPIPGYTQSYRHAMILHLKHLRILNT